MNQTRGSCRTSRVRLARRATYAWHPDAHLSVRHAVAALAGRARPTPIPLPLLLAVVLPVAGVPVSVVPLGRIALLVHRPVVVVVVVVVLAVFGPAPVPVPVPVFARQVT